MPIHTTTFGAVHLSGKEAARFIEQARNDAPKQSAKEAYKRGLPMTKEFDEKGYTVVNVKDLFPN